MNDRHNVKPGTPAFASGTITPEQARVPGEPTVRMLFPKTVLLTVANDRPRISFSPGHQDVPAHLADHVWLKHNGVTRCESPTTLPNAKDAAIAPTRSATGENDPPATSRRLRATVKSVTAARRMETYLEDNAIGQTKFAIQVGTTDRTLRSFRKTGQVRRDIFEAIAKAMGKTKDELLKVE